MRTQVWTALSAILLPCPQLFVNRDAWKWLDEPFGPPPGLPETVIKQLALPLAARGLLGQHASTSAAVNERESRFARPPKRTSIFSTIC